MLPCEFGFLAFFLQLHRQLPRLRLGALEKQSMPHDFFVIAKSCQALESHPGTLVTCPGVPKPQWVLYACFLIVPREFKVFGKFYPMKTSFG